MTKMFALILVLAVAAVQNLVAPAPVSQELPSSDGRAVSIISAEVTEAPIPEPRPTVVYPIRVTPPSPYSEGLTECVVSALEGPLNFRYEPAEPAPAGEEPASGAVWNPGFYQMGVETAWVVKTEGEWSLIWVWGEARGWVKTSDIKSAPCP